MWDIIKRVFLSDKDFMKLISLICIFTSIILGLVFGLKEDKSANFLYLIIAFLSVSFLLMIANKRLKLKKGDAELDLNIDEESEEKNG
jgi:hypothetical protein